MAELLMVPSLVISLEDHAPILAHISTSDPPNSTAISESQQLQDPDKLTQPIASQPIWLSSAQLRLKKQLIIGYCNSRSIINKISLLFSLIYSVDYDIFLITETWLHGSIYDKEISPNGYNIYRFDRSSRGGGVLIFVKSSLPSVLSQPMSNLECVSVVIIYYHHTSSSLASIFHLLLMTPIICPFWTSYTTYLLLMIT